ncbi:MAG: OmpA family protein [Gemmatimonadota bacterium]|jgi:outer membrane protein OmpA-like peptidoglycan-associated protein
MRAPSPTRVFAVSIALMFCLSTTAEAQISRLKKAAADAAERETANQVDRMVTEAVQCAFDDPRCVEEAEKSGKPVVLIDSEGRVITDDEGRPVTDPAKAGAQAGGGGTGEAPVKPGEGVWANYDFVPGQRVMYVDDFSSDRVGDFPQRLEWVRGNMEIVEWEGQRLLRATGANSQFAVLVAGGVPEQFTLEFVIHDPATQQGTRVITGEAPGNVSNYEGDHFNFGNWRGSGIWGQREPLSTIQDVTIRERLVTARIMVDGAHAKAFMDETRIANAPRVDLERSDRITFVLDGKPDRPIYLGQIRLAAGGRDLYDKLAAEGRVATRGIFFDVDSDVIRPESTPTLRDIGDMLDSHPDLSLIIEGHTDSEGEDNYNLELSERRAQAVVRYLVDAQEVSSDRLSAAGLGESAPVADNSTPEGRQQNRRVELVVR